MNKTKFKYHQNDARLWLFKVALFFSVFAFSGFNEKIQSAFHESVQTELVESEIFQAAYTFNTFTKNYNKAPQTSFLSTKDLYSAWALFNFNHFTTIKYKAAIKRTHAYNFSFLKLPIKTALSASEDDLPFFTIG